jgi:HEAT repeat protein
VRLELDRREQWAWRLPAQEDGRLALLTDDGALAWVKLEPPPNWLEESSARLVELPPARLVALFDDASESVRDCGEELLIEQGDPAAAAVGGAVLAESARVRRAALSVLAARPQPQWSARVRERLRDDDVAVRRAALTAYAALAPSDLVATALGVLRFDRDPLLHHDAIAVLGRQGDLRVVDTLLEHLDGCDDRSERLVAFDALRRLTGKKFGRDAEAWRAWWTNHRAELLPLGSA